MSIQNTNTINRYVGNGSTTSFTYNFKINDQSHIEVSLDNVVQTSGFTVTGVGNANGGTVNFATAPANGVKVVLRRNVPYTQLIDYITGDKFPADTHEAALDQLTMAAQQLQEQVDRSLHYPVTATQSAELPDPNDPGNQGKVLRLTAGGIDVVAVQPSDVIQFVTPLTNYANLQSALTAIGSSVATLLIEIPTTVATNVTVPSNVTLWFVNNGSLYHNAGVNATYNCKIVASRGLNNVLTGPGTYTLGATSEWVLPEPPAFTFNTLPAPGIVGRFVRVIDNKRGIWVDNGASFVPQSLGVNVAELATGGNGSLANPWTGWEAAVNAMPANTTFYMPSGYYTQAMTISTKQGWGVYGSGPLATKIMSSVSASSWVVPFDNATLEGFSLSKTGAAGTSVGLDIGTPSGIGHHVTVRRIEVVGFNVGIKISRTFYGGFYDIDAHGNLNHNFLLTDSAIANNFFNVRSRGDGTTLVGVRIDDTTTNSADNTWHGGTFEGAQVQEFEIAGASTTTIIGGHYESNAPFALTGTVTLTNGSTTVSGTGTSFLSELKVGQFIKLNADPARAWMRVNSIANNTSATLSDPYQGTGGSGVASAVGGIILIRGGTATPIRTAIYNPQLSVGSGSSIGVYVLAGQDTMLNIAGPGMPIIIGSGATRTTVCATAFPSGFADLGSGSQIFADVGGGHFYVKEGTNVLYRLFGGGELEINSIYPLRTPPLIGIKGISGTSIAAKNLRGSVTFPGSGTVSVTFAEAEPNASYHVTLGGDSNEVFWVSNKTTAGFTINSSNATSTAVVSWHLIR